MSSSLRDDQLLDEFVFADARGGRKKNVPVQVSVSRTLTKEDMLALVEGTSPAAPQTHSTLVKIRNQHHQLARHIAAGTEMIEVARITGYTPAYISVLMVDPTFQELLAYYEAQSEAKFIDTVERAASLGVQALEELQERLTEAPETFKHRELMEVAQLGLGIAGDKKSATQQASASGAAPTINISFVTPEAPALIDITPKETE